jgi:hypothetical protein
MPERPPFAFGAVSVPAGSARQLELPAGRLPSGTELSLPIEILHGVRGGPTLWLSGAIHGDEIVGVEIIRQVLNAVDAAELAGTIVAAPVVNVFGFVAGSRYLPDHRDLNRSFPGSRRGSMASQLARLFVDEVVDRCDLGLDFHAGSGDRTNLPQVRGNMDDPETRRLAIAFGPAIVIHSEPPKGTLRETALKRGRRVLLFEGGEPRRFSPAAVAAGSTGALRVLAALRMIDARPPSPDVEPFEARSTKWLRAPRGGIFRLEVKLGDRIRNGQQVGVISEPGSRVQTPVRSRAAGVVMGHAVNPLVYRGAALVHVAETAARG